MQAPGSSPPAESPPISAAHRDAWRVFFDVFLRDKPRRIGAMNDMGLTFMQTMALGLLEGDEPVTMSQLAERMQCDNSNITGIADRLEVLGFAERRPAPHDRRVKTLVLTERGRAMKARVHERMGEPPPGFARLSEEDAATLRDLLARTLA